VIAVAPVVEEIFFRGFFYGALRSRYSPVVAALMNGLLFGSIHFNGSAESLLILPPLALLGFIFCLVYEKTGSLYPVIGMHAFNNSLAYAVQADNGWQVSVVLGPLVLAGCALVPRLLPPGPRRVQPAS
jgi:membrane protease YdiL (CAAX protease family)